jgi:FkbM family methyltransferase
MFSKLKWLAKGFIGILNPNTWGVFQETYQITKFDAAFTPSWSQAGEDLCVENILRNTNINKFYLDIGAHDPNRFSVTRRLYGEGWNGIDVDGNSDYEDKFNKFRPRNTFLNVCVGDKESYEFTVFIEGAISTANEEWLEKFNSEGAQVKRRVRVPGIKLRSILDLPSVPKRVGFINIDIEGADEDALRSIEFKSLPKDRFPDWILLETAPPVSSSLNFPAVKYALEHGYTPWLVLPMATLLKAPENNP